jgi:thiosulfate dehydrogenase [quinone] large subunit
MGEDNKVKYVWGLLRLSMGWIFFWAFIDKLFGLGFATSPAKSWLAGGSPTFGFLKFATKGPLAEFYQGLAGNAVADWLFMLGLLFVGLSLLFGIFVKIASYTGILVVLLMYTAGFLPPEHNPFLDEHLIYPLIMFGLTLVNSGHWLGLGKWWSQTKLVAKYPIFE